MSDHDVMANALAIVAAAESGGYDAALGISPEQRDILTRVAAGTTPLSVRDLAVLRETGHDDLIDQAQSAGRFDHLFNHTNTQEN